MAEVQLEKARTTSNYTYHKAVQKVSRPPMSKWSTRFVKKDEVTLQQLLRPRRGLHQNQLQHFQL